MIHIVAIITAKPAIIRTTKTYGIKFSGYSGTGQTVTTVTGIRNNVPSAGTMPSPRLKA